MATVAAPADQASEILQKLSLDSQTKSLEIPEPTKKTSVYQYGSVDSNGQVLSFDRSITPVLPDFVDPTICYVPNGYSPYYFGGTEWSDYSYTNPDGSDMTAGVYGDNGLMYHPGYGYASYAPYSPATSPVPTMGNEGQLYGPQHYQYPSYFPVTPSSGPFASSAVAIPSQGSSDDQKPLSAETGHANSAAVASNGAAKANIAYAPVPVKPVQQNLVNGPNNFNGKGALAGGFHGSAYQDPRFAYDGFHSPMLWQDGSKFSDGLHKPVSGTGYSKANNFPSSKPQNYRSNAHYMGLHNSMPMSGIGTPQNYMNRMYPNKFYGHYGNNGRSGMGYGSAGYDSQLNLKGWVSCDSKYRPRGRGNNFFYGNENVDGLNELNRGPRAKSVKNLKVAVLPAKGPNEISATDNEEMSTSSVASDREQYNKQDFPEGYSDAKFFVIKSYSEDDVHKSIKYSVWASTPNGNKKLDAAYQEAQQKSGGCPVFLFFSVNTSGQFVGLAEMVGPVNFNKNVEYWQQDKWTGSFPLKWHIVKDVPNSMLKHITLENNENKPVTNSRDTQEIKLEQGLKMIKIFKDHSAKTCILDDFAFYETRQKAILEKKARQQPYQKQVWEGKSNNANKESTEATADLAKEPTSTVQANGDVKVSGNGFVAMIGETLNSAKESEDRPVTNGVLNSC